MDRSMKKSSRLSTAEWEALLARIQSPSKELEATLAKSNSNLIEALSGLEELEKLTQMHLAPPAPILPPAPAAGTTPSLAPNTSATAATPPAPVKYQTSREEYAPALNQSALVDALLQYQRNKSARPPQTEKRPAPGFTPMQIPMIETEPKAAPLGRAAAPTVRLPVLRLKPGNPHGDEQS